jgi:hypothetical protein
MVRFGGGLGGIVVLSTAVMLLGASDGNGSAFRSREPKAGMIRPIFV